MALRRNVEGRVNGMAARLPVTRRCLLAAAPDIEVERTTVRTIPIKIISNVKGGIVRPSIREAW